MRKKKRERICYRDCTPVYRTGLTEKVLSIFGVIFAVIISIPIMVIMIIFSVIVNAKRGYLFYNPAKQGCRKCKGKMEESGYPESNHKWKCQKCGWVFRDSGFI